MTLTIKWVVCQEQPMFSRDQCQDPDHNEGCTPKVVVEAVLWPYSEGRYEIGLLWPGVSRTDMMAEAERVARRLNAQQPFSLDTWDGGIQA